MPYNSKHFFRNESMHKAGADFKAGQGAVSSLFFSLPVFAPIRYFFLQNRALTAPAVVKLSPAPKKGKTILWFTDTLNDLNGPSVTLKKLGWLSHERGMNVHLVTSLLEQEMSPDLPPKLINLPFSFHFTLPFYGKYILKIPSLIKSIKLLKSYNPDEFYISTPGTMGLFALLAAGIMGVRKVGIYHTDFYLQSSAVINSTILPRVIERLVRWFYGVMDEVHVPTDEYMDILEKRGYDRSKMKIFRRGLDAGFFSVHPDARMELRRRYGIQDGITLVFTGRMSPDKNLDFLMNVYKDLLKRRSDVNMLLVGDGPYLDDLRASMKDYPRVFCTGRVGQSDLPAIYSGSDVFVFPSIADTFGMSVLEAQSCGLPAIVSDAGGPKEIIINGHTGVVAKANDHADWVARFEYLFDMMANKPAQFASMKEKSRINVLENYNWEAVLAGLAGEQPAYGRPVSCTA